MHEVKTLFNFLPYVESIYPLIKKFKFYNLKDFNETFNENSNWPGYRTQDLHEYCPFLYIHILTLLEESIKVKFTSYKKISMYAHLRFQEDESKDWIHVDSSDTAIIYISNTNFNSGTDFYDAQANSIASIKFIQGSCVFFERGINHRSIGNHGNNIEDGRMTINVFMYR